LKKLRGTIIPAENRPTSAVPQTSAANAPAAQQDPQTEVKPLTPQDPLAIRCLSLSASFETGEPYPTSMTALSKFSSLATGEPSWGTFHGMNYDLQRDFAIRLTPYQNASKQ
jgi:hypothetical protein